jgi:hypothetical protein
VTSGFAASEKCRQEQARTAFELLLSESRLHVGEDEWRQFERRMRARWNRDNARTMKELAEVVSRDLAA